MHCRTGAHRAGTVTPAFGMLCFGYTAEEAVAVVRQRRRVTQVDGDSLFCLKMLQTELKDWKQLDWSPHRPPLRLHPGGALAAAGDLATMELRH